MPFSSAVLQSLTHATLFNERPMLPELWHTPCFFTLSSHNALEALLQRPYSLFIEVGCPHKLAPIISQLVDYAPDFALCLSTPNIYGGTVALTIADHIEQRFSLASSCRIKLRTCLQEALINAVVHGNLEITGQFNSPETMDAYYALIDLRLNDIELRTRRIVVAVWHDSEGLTLGIMDEGNGFPPSHSMIKKSTPHGRGLFLIQSLAERVWIGKDRHTLFMHFEHCMKESHGSPSD